MTTKDEAREAAKVMLVDIFGHCACPAINSAADHMHQFATRATPQPASTDARLREVLEEVMPYLEQGYMDDEADDEPIGWCSDADGKNQRPLELTFGMIRRAREALAATPEPASAPALDPYAHTDGSRECRPASGPYAHSKLTTDEAQDETIAYAATRSDVVDATVREREALIVRMDNVMRDWSDAEASDDWWNYQRYFQQARNFLALSNGHGREQGPACENCLIPVEVGQVVLPWDDAGEMHADCANPYSMNVERGEDGPEPVILLGSPMRQVPLALVQLHATLSPSPTHEALFDAPQSDGDQA